MALLRALLWTMRAVVAVLAVIGAWHVGTLWAAHTLKATEHPPRPSILVPPAAEAPEPDLDGLDLGPVAFPEIPAESEDTVDSPAIEELRARHLLIPVAGVEKDQLHDDFLDPRDGRIHEAVDILAPLGQPVLAVDDGEIHRLVNGARSGLAVHQWSPEKRYLYFYAHLDGYAEGLKQGDPVRRGQLLGYVGTTGNAPPGTPHLHFAIRRVPAPGTWWQGEVINPYAVLQ